MVNVIRHFYQEVVFVVPNLAMSAGTILAMSGDAIMMDYFACLGPIDPQVERDGKLVPALSYLLQWDRFVGKSQNGTLTDAEFLIMRGMDLAELHQFEMARDLSISLLKQWLATYKFKDWTTTETNQTKVTHAMRVARAEEIAVRLMKHDEWGSHGRAISMRVLQQELKLRIDDFGTDAVLASKLSSYFELLTDYMNRNKFENYVHSREFD
jgi:membrane-bound ClpP family serine protease